MKTWNNENWSLKSSWRIKLITELARHSPCITVAWIASLEKSVRVWDPSRICSLLSRATYIINIASTVVRLQYPVLYQRGDVVIRTVISVPILPRENDYGQWLLYADWMDWICKLVDVSVLHIVSLHLFIPAFGELNLQDCLCTCGDFAWKYLGADTSSPLYLPRDSPRWLAELRALAA